jgi:hypothetical protein
MASIPDPKRHAKADKQWHQYNVWAPDARKQNKDLIRMGVWAPREQADRFKVAAERAVDHHLNPVRTDRTLADMPSSWRDPKAACDRRQESLPL